MIFVFNTGNYSKFKIDKAAFCSSPPNSTAHPFNRLLMEKEWNGNYI